MKSHLRCHFLLLGFLFVRAVVLVKASNKAISCENDTNCQALVKLMEAVNEINNKLEEPASCSDEKLDKLAEKLDKLAATVHEIHGKQVKDVEELKVNMNRSLSSTAAISVQLEKHSADLFRHDERLKTHDVSQNNIYELVKSIHSFQPNPKDCSDIRNRGNSFSGVYRVDLGSDHRRIEADVYCDFRTVGQSWLVFQRRKDGSVDFYRNWNDYANGFGDLTGEFWLGNEKLSLLTMNKKYKLRIELEDFLGGKSWAEYSTFSVNPSTDKYRLTVAGYSGNAADSLTYHNNMMFSTKDADNDLSSGNCAQVYPGGWWFKYCHASNLNGLYRGGSHPLDAKGICWYYWKGSWYSMKATEMKITAV